MNKLWGCVRGAIAASVILASASWAETAITLDVAGGDEDLRTSLRRSSLVIQSIDEEDDDPQTLLAAAQADYTRLLGTLYANARYGGVISIRLDGREAAGIRPLGPPQRIDQIEITIDPGPTYLFSEATVDPVAPESEIPEEFAPGAPADVGAIESAATAAIEGWRDVGYAKAEVADQSIVARHSENRVAARLAIAPGPRLRFGATTVSGNEDVRTRRILTIAGLPEGRVFDPDEVERAARRLRRTGTFRSVVIEEAETPNTDGTLPFNIGVVEQTPRRFGVGLELSTTEGVRVSGFWLHRNFLGGAERFRVDGEVAGISGDTGGIDYSLGVRYERPATPRADTDLFASLSFRREDEPDYLSDIFEFNLGFTRYATDDLTVEYGLGYLYSETDDDFGSETIQLLTLPLAATLDRRDSELNPREGYFVDLELTPFYGIAGTSEGAQAKLDTRYYLTAGGDRKFTFATRLQLGSLFGPEFLDSPPFYRFYSGGGGTVRGQDYQSLAVELGSDQRTGGRTFLGLSGELRADLTERIQGVAFVDYGYIGRETFYDGSGSDHAGAGLGVRYNTGIGPIRLDVAAPIAGDTDASSFYIYVGIGQAF